MAAPASNLQVNRYTRTAGWKNKHRTKGKYGIRGVSYWGFLSQFANLKLSFRAPLAQLGYPILNEAVLSDKQMGMCWSMHNICYRNMAIVFFLRNFVQSLRCDMRFLGVWPGCGVNLDVPSDKKKGYTIRPELPHLYLFLECWSLSKNNVLSVPCPLDWAKGGYINVHVLDLMSWSFTWSSWNGDQCLVKVWKIFRKTIK